MSRASDEVADVFITDKRGHCFAESRTGVVGCEDPGRAAPVLAFHVCNVGSLPCGAAALDCDPAFFGVGVGVKRRERNGLDQAEFRGRFCRQFWSHGGFSLFRGQGSGIRDHPRPALAPSSIVW